VKCAADLPGGLPGEGPVFDHQHAIDGDMAIAEASPCSYRRMAASALNVDICRVGGAPRAIDKPSLSNQQIVHILWLLMAQAAVYRLGSRADG
jgi:hypothetical protein